MVARNDLSASMLAKVIGASVAGYASHRARSSSFATWRGSTGTVA